MRHPRGWGINKVIYGKQGRNKPFLLYSSIKQGRNEHFDKMGGEEIKTFGQNIYRWKLFLLLNKCANSVEKNPPTSTV